MSRGDHMKRPVVFVSSTIYDFADLRSALKYWLNEMGFDAQLSEYNDFQKNLNVNSYEACLQAIEKSDYFVLLIGTRRGGMFPDENISITRKEYRVAYDLAKAGKIKKLIVFIRQSVWDVKEDRKSLHKLLQGLTILENGKEIDVSAIENYNSNILQNAEHISGFIDEVTRKEDARNGKMPNLNWVHTFNHFEDIIRTLKNELNLSVDISTQIAEQNLEMALTHTLQKITYEAEPGVIAAYYLPFDEIRKKLKNFRDNNKIVTGRETITLTKEEVDSISDFVLFYYIGIEELNTYEFENALSSGAFMDFDREKETPVYNNFCRMLHQLIEEINRVKRFVRDISPEIQQRLMNTARGDYNRDPETYEFLFVDLGQLSAIYERLINITRISFYLARCIKEHKRDLEPPTILNGLVNMGRPLETDILRLFQGDDDAK